MGAHTPSGPLAEAAGPPDDLRQLGHDLRHCLYVMKTGVQILERAIQPTEEVAEVIDSMRREADRAAELVTKLLAAASGRTG